MVPSSFLFKAFGFFLVFYGEYLNYCKYSFNLLKNPFILGVYSIMVANFFTFITIQNEIDYTYPIMYLFIVTKIISQIYHSKHLNWFGGPK